MKLKLENYFIFCFFLLISVIGLAKNNKSDEIILTDDGIILNLKGNFKIKWDKRLEDTPCHITGYGEMLFYPENRDIVNGKPIVLVARNFDYYNWDESKDAEKEFSDIEKAKIEVLKKSFPEEFEKMEKIQKGEFQVPAKVKIKKITAYTECDFTTVYGYATEIKKIDGAKSEIKEHKVNKSDIPDNFEDPDENFALKEYEVNSRDGYANMREKPATSSKILKRLDNRETVKYIMADGDWYYVYIVDYPGKNSKNSKITEFRGFVHKSQLRRDVY